MKQELSQERILSLAKNIASMGPSYFSSDIPSIGVILNTFAQNNDILMLIV
jgi:hypothetical protein